jgi:hypothetical protein
MSVALQPVATLQLHQALNPLLPLLLLLLLLLLLSLLPSEAPAGSFVTGVTTTLCPRGEYSDDYSLSTACKTCEDLFDGPGITTAREGSTSARNCTFLEPGYALLDDKKRVILGAVDLINTPISGAKKCPQNWVW